MKSISFFLLIYFPLVVSGQIVFGDEQIIDGQVIRPYSISAADIDGDGDKDVILADEQSNKIAWYENLDGLGNFGDQLVINTQDGAKSAYAADIDGDGDLDIVSGSEFDDTVAWYENLDGLGNFGGQLIISTQADGAWSVYAADVDSDGDMDIISASAYDGKIAWYKNEDGLGSFGGQLIISDQAGLTRSVFAADFDGDGDIDVNAAIWELDKIAWYQNQDGLGSFSDPLTVSTQASAAIAVYAADIDGDNDMDIISASRGEDKIAWYENQDGLGDFGSQSIISTQASGASFVYAEDLDNDGDIDVLSASPFDDKIAWYENQDGLGSFGNQLVISTQVSSAICVHAADMDGDEDVDVLAAAWGGNKIVWYKNLLNPTDVNEIDLTRSIQIDPNPFKDFTHFSIRELPTRNEAILEIRHIDGKLMERQMVSSNSTLQIGNNNYSSGLYFYELRAMDNNHILEKGKLIKI